MSTSNPSVPLFGPYNATPAVGVANRKTTDPGPFVFMPRAAKMQKKSDGEMPSAAPRMLSVVLSVVQVVSAAIGWRAAANWQGQIDTVRADGYPAMFTEDSLSASSTGLRYLALAYFISALEWGITFVLTSCPPFAKFTHGSFSESDNALNVFKVRQIGYMVCDTLVAAIMLLLSTEAPSAEDRTAFAVEGAFGVSDAMLNRLTPHGTEHPGVDRVDVGVQAAYLISNGASANIEVMLVIVAGLRLIVIVLQAALYEGCNVAYIVPCCRGPTEFQGPGVGWSNADARKDQKDSLEDYDKNIIPSELSDKYSVCCSKPVPRTTLKKHTCVCMAAFTHNHMGSLRAWLYLSTVLFFFGSLSLLNGVVGPPMTVSPLSSHGGRYFWPAYWPDGSSAFHENLQSIYGPNGNVTNSSEAIMATLQADLITSGVFPRSLELLDPKTGPGNDAVSRTSTAVLLFTLAELCRLVSALAYTVGSIRNEASLAGNHVQPTDHVWRTLMP